MGRFEPSWTAVPTTVPLAPPPSPPLVFLADRAAGSDFVYLAALAAAAAAMAILSYRTTVSSSRGKREADAVPSSPTAAAALSPLASNPPPIPTLFELLNLDPSNPSSRSLYDDDAVRRAVQADPSATTTKHRFPLGHGLSSAPIHPLSMACCLGASKRTVLALYHAHPDAITHHDRQKKYAPIHWAVRYSKESQVDPEVLRLLANAYVHSGESSSKHPLRVAILHDAGPDAVKILANLWPDDKRARARARALHLAAEHSASVEVCRALLDAFPDVIAVTDREKCTPLHAALKYGARDDVVALFIEAAAKQEVLGKSDRAGNTPLHLAAERGQSASVEVCRALLNVFPDAIAATDREERTPLHVALKYGAGDDVVSLFIEAAAANLGGDRGEFLRRSGRVGNTPLHVACAARAPLDVLRSIVEVDPSMVRQTNKRGEVPLDVLRDALTKKEQRAALPYADEICLGGNDDEAFGEEAFALRERIYLLLQASYKETVVADEECCICWDPLRSSEKTVEGLFCGHFFHTGCIQEWFQEGRNCPLCRGSTEGVAARMGF